MVKKEQMYVGMREGQREFTWASVKGDAMGEGEGAIRFSLSRAGMIRS